ncbi:hypothetical protein ACFOTA_21575 [Chitinophaga sp. GCM10012297]|uniref:Uncharacterized protein n=1 Tax=Chitinophaga chungangae TaxID=2821488 RepID=A0ABS3YJJ2_9BACT|nr:hypothetical protein [Chitinophaga chungangae]MBO9154819.1 hypothetical protein [Chitinophaga chungangae]
MEFLYISNRVLLSGYIAYGLIFILHIGFLIVYIRSLRAGEFVGGEYSLSGDWRRVLPLLVCLQLPFLFLWRSLRTKTWLTIFVAASALIALYYERIVVFLTGFLRDYVPSSWSYYHDRSNTWWFILAGLPAYFAIIYVLAGERARKRGDTF